MFSDSSLDLLMLPFSSWMCFHVEVRGAVWWRWIFQPNAIFSFLLIAHKSSFGNLFLNQLHLNLTGDSCTICLLFSYRSATSFQISVRWAFKMDVFAQICIYSHHNLIELTLPAWTLCYANMYNLKHTRCFSPCHYLITKKLRFKIKVGNANTLSFNSWMIHL